MDNFKCDECGCDITEDDEGFCDKCGEALCNEDDDDEGEFDE